MYESITANIMVKDVKETIAFYETVLGFQKVVSVPEDGEVLNFAILARDHVSVMFQEQNNLLEEYPSLKTGEILPTFTLFITVQDVETLYKELCEKAVIAKEFHKTFYGKDEFAVFDNNGNVLTISNS